MLKYLFHTEESSMNLVNTNQILTVIKFFRLIWCQIYRKSVITVKVWFNLTVIRKHISKTKFVQNICLAVFCNSSESLSNKMYHLFSSCNYINSWKIKT